MQGYLKFHRTCSDNGCIDNWLCLKTKINLGIWCGGQLYKMFTTSFGVLWP